MKLSYTGTRRDVNVKQGILLVPQYLYESVLFWGFLKEKNGKENLEHARTYQGHPLIFLFRLRLLFYLEVSS